MSGYGSYYSYHKTTNYLNATRHRDHGNSIYTSYYKYHGTYDYLIAHNLIRAHAKVYHLYDKNFRYKQNGLYKCLLL